MFILKVFLRSSQSLKIFMLPVVIGIFAVTTFAQTDRREIDCQLSLDDRLLEVKTAIPATKLTKVSFRISDWAGVNNYADNIYKMRAIDAEGNDFRLEKTDERTWTVNGNGRAFTLSYQVASQKDSFVGNSSRGHFHPTLFREYAFL